MLGVLLLIIAGVMFGLSTWLYHKSRVQRRQAQRLLDEMLAEREQAERLLDIARKVTGNKSQEKDPQIGAFRVPRWAGELLKDSSNLDEE